MCASFPVIEIDEIPPLSPGEHSLIEQHSIINTLGVLRGELQVLGLKLANDEKLFVRGITVCDGMLAALSNRELALGQAARVDVHETIVFSELRSVLADRPDPRTEARRGDFEANLRSVFAILRLRAREILARAAEPDHWATFDPVRVLADLRFFFRAIETNSNGRFRIRFNAAQQEFADYYIDLKIETAAHLSLAMPLAFCDVMRDLISNARKYTLPGGHIVAAVYEDHDYMQFVVTDTGRGIPAGELAKVVQFGERASNVKDVRTYGGGFGLTKAFLLTKQFNGRFWIGSELGAGTRIRIQIPCPKDPTTGVPAPVRAAWKDPEI